VKISRFKQGKQLRTPNQNNREIYKRYISFAGIYEKKRRGEREREREKERDFMKAIKHVI